MSWEAVFAGTAVAVSIFASWLAIRAHREAITQGTYADVYEEFSALSELRLSHWELSHLQELPENYGPVVATIRTALGDLGGDRRNQLLIQERAVAMRIFSLFEQAHYQCVHARMHGDHGRTEFLDDVLTYFTGRLLRNPRLLYFWSREGANLCIHYEPGTIERYEAGIPAQVFADGTCTMDSDGPFGGGRHAQVVDRAV